MKDDNEVNIYFPEHIFEDQFFQKNNDLLDLENLLAKSVHAVVMCPESPGSFAELGAFANHSQLKEKLIVYLNEKHKRNDSFIKIGPVKHLLKTKSKVIWRNYSYFNDRDKTDLLKYIREIKRHTLVENNLLNPLFCERFLLSLLYVMGNYSRKEIINIIKNIKLKESEENNIEEIITTVDSSLSVLLKRREIKLNYPHYYLSTFGIRKLNNELSRPLIYKVLDKKRITMLNLSLRTYWN